MPDASAAAFAIDTSDLDQARELVSRAIAPFGLRPCGGGAYRARVRAGRIGALGLAEVSYRGAVEIESQLAGDTWILEVPVAGVCGAERWRADGEVRRGDVLVSRPGRAIRTWMGDGSRLLVFRGPVAMLHRPLTPRHPRRLRPDRLASLERLTRLIFETSPAAGAAATDPHLAAEMQRVVLSLLGLGGDVDGDAGLVPEKAPAKVEDPATVLPRTVRRAQALMIAAPAGGMTLPDLAGRCGVSVRTLQENFRQFTGATPSEWWRGYRLDRVHATLSGGAEGTRVTETATEFGFFHLGRFAQQYRERFGETPSETLRWARAAVA